MRLFGSLLSLSSLAVLAAACSISPSSDEDSKDGSNLVAAAGSNVCSTLDYGHTKSNEKMYVQFPDDAAALDFAQGFLAANGKPEATEISRDATLTALVAEVYAGFRRVFPRETSGLEQAPRVVVVNSEEVNAFAGFDDRTGVDTGPWLLFVNRGVVEDKAGIPKLEGLIVHELAHLILRNVLPETRAKIRRHYRIQHGAESGVIGAFTADDAAVEKRVAEYRSLEAKVGRETVFGSLPISALTQFEYQTALGTLLGGRERSPDQASCDVGHERLDQVIAFSQPLSSPHDWVLALDAAQRTQLEALSRAAVEPLRKCYAHVKVSLFHLKVLGRVAELPPEEASATLAKALDPATPEHRKSFDELMTNDIEKQIDQDDADQPTIDRLFKVVEKLHQRVGELDADKSLPVDDIRVFDNEEDADDAAVRVLTALGKDPLGNGRFVVQLLPDPAKCIADVAAGKVPAYGRFIDPHNTTCWRWFHTVQMANALKSCPAQAAPESGTRGSGKSSPYDAKASAQIEWEAMPRASSARSEKP